MGSLNNPARFFDPFLFDTVSKTPLYNYRPLHNTKYILNFSFCLSRMCLLGSQSSRMEYKKGFNQNDPRNLENMKTFPLCSCHHSYYGDLIQQIFAKVNFTSDSLNLHSVQRFMSLVFCQHLSLLSQFA